MRESDSVLEAAVAARQPWADAGLERRLEALSLAGRRLAEQVDALYAGLRADHLSQALAETYGTWILHAGSPELLARYARDHLQWIPGERGGELMVRRPDGLVLFVPPGNSPTINAAPLFSILLAGNVVICRAPANDTGLRFLALDLIRQAVEDCGLPGDVVQVVTSRSRDFLGRFVESDEVRTVVFFGNSVAGASVAERCHALGKKCVLELEGSDHQLVWADADLDAAVDSALRAYDFSTQPCPVPKHFLVHEAAADGFVQRLLKRLPEVSRTIEADPVGGNLVPVAHPDAYFAALDELGPDAKVFCGGHRMNAQGERDPDGRYLAPALVGLDHGQVIGRSLALFEAEIAFPLIPVVRFSGTDAQIREAMARVVRDSPFGLRCSLFAQDPAVLGWFTAAIEHPGLLLLNEAHATCPDYAAPWGGPRRSGGPHGENHLFWQKTSHLQGIACHHLDLAQRRAVLEALGMAGLAEAAGVLPVPAPLTVDVAGGVATVELARPERHNAFDRAMGDALAAAVDRIAGDPEVRVVVLRGAGRSFCSGADLRMLGGLSAAEARRFMLDATWSFRALERLPVPVIAQVHGYCMGGGFELALHCDEVICADDAVLALPETGIGLTTTAGSVARLIGALGSVRARELLLAGRRLTGAEAATLGLATAAVSAGELEGEVARRVAAYLAMPAEGLRAMKALIRRRVEPGAAGSWLDETEVFEGLVHERKQAEEDA